MITVLGTEHRRTHVLGPESAPVKVFCQRPIEEDVDEEDVDLVTDGPGHELPDEMVRAVAATGQVVFAMPMDAQLDVVELAALYAVLVDDATAPEEIYDLLEERPDLYNESTREMLGQGMAFALMMADIEPDASVMSSQIDQRVNFNLGFFGRPTRLLELCSELGLERAFDEVYAGAFSRRRR